jgi:transcriptional regulator with XRE-family HTH domain
MAVNLLAESKGRFGNYLATLMERNGMDARALAADSHRSYEHIRKLVKSEALPSPEIVEKFDKVLKGFDVKQATALYSQDKAQRTFKKDFNQLAGVPEDADELLKAWPYLSPEHKDTIMIMVSAFQKTDRGTKGDNGV